MSRRINKERAPLPKGAQGTRPMIAVVGRPNVGKSTLFNRMARRKLAIVEDMPGVTRDRHYSDTTLRSRKSNLKARECVLIDTGGFDPESDDPMTVNIVSQVELGF